jgi:hypothetical protein
MGLFGSLVSRLRPVLSSANPSGCYSTFLAIPATSVFPCLRQGREVFVVVIIELGRL